jgi:Beta-lactamase enzyme family
MAIHQPERSRKSGRYLVDVNRQLHHPTRPAPRRSRVRPVLSLILTLGLVGACSPADGDGTTIPEPTTTTGPTSTTASMPTTSTSEAPPSLGDPPATLEEAYERLETFGDLRAISAEIVDDECVTIDAVAADSPAPIGSVFELYVLAALGEAVRSGDVTWDDAIVIDDDLKSVPGGILQDREPGDTVTVLEAARLMISISDNTATDHLIALLGREVVEQTLADYGNTSSELTTPLPSTRELSALKVGPASGLRTPGWIEGDEADRRAILDQISGITPADIPVQEWVDPIDPDLVEWFASPDDLCALAVGLTSLAVGVPEVSEILQIDPGVPATDGAWNQIWFKDGFEPGLVAVWWLTSQDDRLFLTAGSVVDPVTTFDRHEATLLFAAARDLLEP